MHLVTLVSIFICLLLNNLSFSLCDSFNVSLSSLLHLSLLLPRPSPLPFVTPLCTYGGSPVVFLSGWWWVDGGGGGWWCLEGKKGPVKQREVVCRRGRQETQVSQDSPPVTAPWLYCRPTPDWTWQPRWATAARLLFVPLHPLFLSFSLLHSPFFHSFDHILIYSLFFGFVVSSYPSFYFTHMFLYCHLYRLTLLLHIQSQGAEALLSSGDRNGPFTKALGVKSWKVRN